MHQLLSERVFTFRLFEGVKMHDFGPYVGYGVKISGSEAPENSSEGSVLEKCCSLVKNTVLDEMEARNTIKTKI